MNKEIEEFEEVEEQLSVVGGFAESLGEFEELESRCGSSAHCGLTQLTLTDADAFMSQ
jgi:hypothetical protein